MDGDPFHRNRILQIRSLQTNSIWLSLILMRKSAQVKHFANARHARTPHQVHRHIQTRATSRNFFSFDASDLSHSTLTRDLMWQRNLF